MRSNELPRKALVSSSPPGTVYYFGKEQNNNWKSRRGKKFFAKVQKLVGRYVHIGLKMSILGRRMLKFPHNYKVLKTSKCWMKFCLFAWHRSSCTSYTNSFVFMIVKPSKKWNKKAIPRCEILSECWAEFKWPQSVCFLLLGWLMQKLLYIISLVCLGDSIWHVKMTSKPTSLAIHQFASYSVWPESL